MSRFGSRAESPEPVERLSSIPSIGLSNFKPSQDNIKELKDGTLALRLVPGEVNILKSALVMIY
jgi:hypothetical protein